MLNKNTMATMGTANNKTGSHIKVLNYVFVMNVAMIQLRNGYEMDVNV